MSKKHTIKPGFISWFTTCNKFPQFGEWHFVFIIPNGNGQILKCSYFQIGKLPDFRPFLAQVAMNGYAKLVANSTKLNLKKSIKKEKERERPKKIKLMPAKGLNDGEGFKQKGGVKGKGKAEKQRPK